jgi:hypothetical protein
VQARMLFQARGCCEEEGECKEKGCCKADIGCTNVVEEWKRGAFADSDRQEDGGGEKKLQADAIKCIK